MDAKESAHRFVIYQYACKVLILPKAKRAALIEQHPQPEMVRAEVLRIYKYREHK